MNFGYLLVEDDPQSLDQTIHALISAGCARIFREHNPSDPARPRLTRLLDGLREDDTLIVCKLSCLGRSLKELVKTLNAIHAKNAQCRSQYEHFDSRSPAGRMMFCLMTILADYEQDAPCQADDSPPHSPSNWLAVEVAPMLGPAKEGE